MIFNFRDARPMQPSASQCQAASPSAADDCRCLCGSLLARVVDGQVELKCRRCKRTLLVPIAELPGGDVHVSPPALGRAV